MAKMSVGYLIQRFLSKPQFNLTQIRHVSSVLSRSPYEEVKMDIDLNSSKDKPMKVNAYGEERTIACVCDDMHFMTLKKGPPVKCKCGHWFQLVDAKKFWTESPET